MKKIFICTNVNQLINFHLNHKSIKNNVLVCIKNKSVINTNVVNHIKYFSSQFNFQFIDNLKNNNFSEIDLISRNDVNLDEIDFINKFKINKWFVVEDGIGDYMRSFKFKFSKCKIPYLFYRLFDKSYKFLAIYYFMFFKKYKRTFNYKSKIINNLICSDNKNIHHYNSIFWNKSKKEKIYDLIIIGSLYSNYTNGFNSIYEKMYDESQKNNISPNQILYVPHPRMSKANISRIKKKYMWCIDNSGFPVEKIILNMKPNIIWTSFSSSVIYLKILLNIDCKLFCPNDFREYYRVKDFIRLRSIYCFFKSIGCKIMYF